MGVGRGAGEDGPSPGRCAWLKSPSRARSWQPPWLVTGTEDRRAGPPYAWAEPGLALWSCLGAPTAQSIQKVLRAGGGRAAEGSEGWLSHVTGVPGQGLRGFEGSLQPTFRGQGPRWKPWSQAELRAQSQQPQTSGELPATCAGAEAGRPGVRGHSQCWPERPPRAQESPAHTQLLPKREKRRILNF